MYDGGDGRAGPASGEAGGRPAVGAGNTLTVTYRPPGGEETYLAKVSGPGLPTPFWQVWEELQRLGVPAESVSAAHSELEPCRLPGCYCAALLRDFAFPHAEISCGRPYGETRAERDAAVAANAEQAAMMAQLMGQPAAPAASPVPVPAAPEAPPLDGAQLGRVLASAFGPDGVRRYPRDELDRLRVPAPQAAALAEAGLPAKVPHIFQAWAAKPIAEQLRTRRSPLSGQALANLDLFVSIGGDGHCFLSVVTDGPPHIIGRVWAVDPITGKTRFVNTGPAELARSLTLLARGRQRMRGLDPYAAGAMVERIQEQLAAVDPPAFHGEDRWWSLVVEQMWNGLL
ncbi:SUKH-4 family immunity protein [Actinomadura verrucosospora]|uniref:SUKH-4 multi-domain protein n=1 Tax=Actinomadura verrucosospora TaxID=46165 RepID=A0A7D3VRD0_ACTVE|nr:SUKH-4 family immunity protein [Actinomadura verrucosospora]QKG21118.1 SUKH-4 multi-domain protein [Actinomadura verrucosospora]